MAKEPAEQADKNEAESPAATAKPTAPKTGMLVVVVIGFLVMILTPLITFFVVKATVPKADKPTQEHHEGDSREGAHEATPEYVVEVKQVTVNIAGTVFTRYLRLEPHLVVSEAGLQEELKKREALLYDRIAQIAGAKTMMDLEGENGREALKKEIKQKLNAEISSKQLHGTILDVYFKDFLIQ